MLSFVRTLAPICFAVILVLANVFASRADTPSYRLEELEKLEGQQKAAEMIKEATGILLKNHNDMESQCMKAFGSKNFCGCIADKSPLVSFSEYVNLTILTKEQLKYDALSDDDKKLLDAVRKARDICASASLQ